MGDDYSSNCGYDVALNSMEHLYGNENFQTYREMNFQKKELAVLYTFDQKPFAANESRMLGYGYILVPRDCENGETCRLHVHFHSCMARSDEQKDIYIRRTGLLEYASTNRIVMLFPQSDFQSINCWAERIDSPTIDPNHPQIQTLVNMVTYLANVDDISKVTTKDRKEYRPYRHSPEDAPHLEYTRPNISQELAGENDLL